LGPSIQPEKPSPKSASTANPPQKVVFIVILLIRDPISTMGLFDHYHAMELYAYLCPFLLLLFGKVAQFFSVLL
jgi:hypothetical protein